MASEGAEVPVNPESVEVRNRKPVQEAREARDRALQAVKEVNTHFTEWINSHDLVPRPTKEGDNPKAYKEYMHRDPQTGKQTYLQVTVESLGPVNGVQVDEWEQISLETGKKRWRETRRTHTVDDPDRDMISLVGFSDNNTDGEGGISDVLSVYRAQNLYGRNLLGNVLGKKLGYIDDSSDISGGDPVENAKRILDLLNSPSTSEYIRPNQPKQPTQSTQTQK